MFRSWAKREGHANRLILDEAHQVLTDRNFRTQFKDLTNLASFRVQKIMITASLPQRLANRFLMNLGLPLSTIIIRAPCDQPRISYNLVRYNTMTTKETRLAIDIAKLLEKDFMDPDQIGIIYCTSKQQARVIDAEFTHCASYSDLGDRKEKYEDMWKTWNATKVDEKGDRLPGRWIAATTGLIHGVNPGNVGGVIFIGMPFGLVNFYQGAGRGGRDGRKSWCVLMDATNHHHLAGRIDDDDNCATEGNRWTAAEECRRLEFTRTFDGKEVSCIDLPNCHLCDHCDHDSSVMAEIAKIIVDPVVNTHPIAHASSASLTTSKSTSLSRVTDDSDNEYDRSINNSIDFDSIDFETIPALSTQPHAPTLPSLTSIRTRIAPPPHLAPRSTTEPSLEIERDIVMAKQLHKRKIDKSNFLNRVTSILVGNCIVCWCHSGTIRSKHEQPFGPICKQSGWSNNMIGWMDLKKLIRFRPYEYCWKCQLPQEKEFQPKAHVDLSSGAKGKKQCNLEDFVIHVVWYVRHDDRWWAAACQRFGNLEVNPNADRLAVWLNRVEGPDCFWNGLELALWFFEIKGLYH